MLRDSIDNAEDDFQRRLTADAKTEAETLLHFLDKEMKKHGELLSEEDRELIDTEAADLRDILETAAHNAIRDQMAKVDAASRPMAEKIMESSVRGALKSKSVDDVMAAGGRGSLAK